MNHINQLETITVECGQQTRPKETLRASALARSKSRLWVAIARVLKRELNCYMNKSFIPWGEPSSRVLSIKMEICGNHLHGVVRKIWDDFLPASPEHEITD